MCVTFFKLRNDLPHFLGSIRKSNLKGAWRVEGDLVVRLFLKARQLAITVFVSSSTPPHPHF